MPSNLHISDFLDPVNLAELSQDQGYKDGQIGKLIDAYDEFFPDLEEANLVVVGCDEERGIGRTAIDRMRLTLSGRSFTSCITGIRISVWRMWEISAPVLPLLTLMLPLKQ